MLRTTQVSNRNSSGGNLNQFAYTYNAQDMRATEVITNGNAINSLANNQTQYDYNRLNQLLGSANPDKNYQYDADGNMTQGYTATGFVFTASYDAENRMTQLIYTDGQGIVQKTVYAYGANDLVAIIEKYAGESLVSTTRFVRDGFLPIQERNASNAVTRQYVWRSGALGGIGQLLSLSQAGQTYEYLYDGKGNVSAVIDENQAIVASYRYDAFGVLLSESGSLNQPMRFSTKYYDADTGLSDYGYRFYVASVGRWLNRDPIGENGGVNLYGFVGNNALNFVDSYGLEVYGFSVGGGVTLGHVFLGASITFAFDTNFEGTVVTTPEIGISTSTLGLSLFVRGIVGPDVNTTVNDLLGSGNSLSVTLGTLSTSTTFPGNPNEIGIEAPISEFGIGTPGIDGTISYGYGVSFSDYIKMLSGVFQNPIIRKNSCE